VLIVTRYVEAVESEEDIALEGKAKIEVKGNKAVNSALNAMPAK
jgi:hypothetical protein